MTTMTTMNKITTGMRAAAVTGDVNLEARTVEVTFGTEYPVLRYDWRGDRYFWEELGFKSGEVRTERLMAGVPILDNHNQFAGVRGVFGKAIGKIDGKQGTAVMRFSGREDVEPVFRDVVDGILDTVSVGYKVHGYVDTGRKGENGYPIYRAIDWEPMEISLAPIPADPRARLRSEGQDEYDVPVIVEAADSADDRAAEGIASTAQDILSKPAPQGAMLEATRAEGTNHKSFKAMNINQLKAERADKENALAAISALAKSGEALTEEQSQRQAALVSEIESVDARIRTEEKTEALLAARAARAVAGEASSDGDGVEVRKMVKRASLADAITSIDKRGEVDGVWGEFTQWSRSQNYGTGADISIPTQVIDYLRTGVADNFQIDAGQGSAFRPTEVPAFIEKLLAPFIFEQLGTTVLTGLVGEQQFPRQTVHGASTAEGEVDEATTAGIQLGDLTMNAKRYAATTSYSKKMLIQSPLNAEGIIANLLRQAFQRKLEFDFFTGASGGDNIVGIFNAANVNAPTFADTTAHAANSAELFKAILEDGANMANARYVLSPLVHQLWSRAVKVTGVSSLMDMNNAIDGVPTVASPYLQNASATAGRVVIGDFSQAYFGYWGSFDLVIDPYTLKKNNRVELSGNMFVDLGLANPEAFAVADDISAT